MEKAAAWLKKSLAYEFQDESLLRQALTHRSASGSNNERLEFLGDAVLQLVASELVYQQLEQASEGQLSRQRSSLVRDVTLADVAIALDLGAHLILGSGEKKTGGHRRSSILADSLEAIFGAVYLDAGFHAARDVIHKAYGTRLHRLAESSDLRDPKSRLQELLQSRQLALPNYEVERISGKAHKQSFEVRCTLVELGSSSVGRGLSRRDAEQEAARVMLQQMENTQT